MPLKSKWIAGNSSRTRSSVALNGGWFTKLGSPASDMSVSLSPAFPGADLVRNCLQLDIMSTL